jgi:hypothetical protein
VDIGRELAEQMKQALKAGRRERLGALRMLKSELEVAQASGRDYDPVQVVRSHAGTLRKSAEEYEELGLKERAEALRGQLAVVEEFLPEQMGREQLEELIDGLIRDNEYGPGDVGRLMGELMGRHGDVVDGRLANEIARQKLAGGQ